MKIPVKSLSYEQVLSLPRPQAHKPKKPSRLLALVTRLLAKKDLKDTAFSYTVEEGIDALGPCLILMNHSSWIDLEMASVIFKNRPYNIVCTGDGFVGKRALMEHLGCIPTQKFVTDFSLMSDMAYALHTNKSSVLLYPEASYSFDGCATPLPRRMGLLLKKLNVPVLFVKTEGAFIRDPLYNCLQKRQVKVSAHVSLLCTKEELKSLSVQELDDRLDAAFCFDNFALQREQGVEVTEPFRAKGLERILFRCAHCGKEGGMKGEGTELSCGYCHKRYSLTPLGQLSAMEGETEFPHIPHWYNWEREQIKEELLTGRYRMDMPVKIGMMVDYKAIYMVGEGRLTHDEQGFSLTGCDGKLRYEQSALSCYGLYADYYWYELGDVICIGNKEQLYYCFPTDNSPVAKARLAAEELYKWKKGSKAR